MQRAVRSSDWSALRFMVFDAPLANVPVESRLSSVRSLALPSFCSVVEHSRCSGRADLQSRFASVVSIGGEGLILRAPGSFYVPARSPRLLKVKPHGVD